MITLIGQEFYLAWSRGNRQGSLPASRITVTSLAKGSSSKSPSITTSTSYCTFPQIFKARLKYFLLATKYFLSNYLFGMAKKLCPVFLENFHWCILILLKPNSREYWWRKYAFSCKSNRTLYISQWPVKTSWIQIHKCPR